MSLPTNYARKYGIHPGAPFGPGKSGLTPIGPSFNDGVLQSEREDYQRVVFRGHTSQDLVELDCLTDRPLKPNDLANEIWPMFQQSNWVPLNNPLYELDLSTLGPDQYGNLRYGWIAWDINDPRIWEHVEPCLRLACQILSRIATLPWFDALLMGNMEVIPSERFSRKDMIRMTEEEHIKYKTFRPRTQEERLRGPSSADKLRTLIREVFSPRLKMGFLYRNTNSLLGGSPLVANEPPALGTSIVDKGDLWMFLSCQSIIPLMRGDLTSSERLVQTFQTAVTIVHEFMHITWFAMDNFQSGVFKLQDNPEPYYQEEQENELGHSMEQALFGANLISDIDRTFLPIPARSVAPSLAIFARKFPAILSDSPYPKLDKPGMTSPYFTSPIPVTFYENLNSDAFWDVQVRAMGLNAVQIPKARSTMYYNFSKARWLPVRGDLADCEEYLRSIEATEAARLASLTPNERIEHVRVMKENLVASYQPLTVRRNLKVQSIRELSDTMSVPYSNDAMSQSILANMVPLLEQLWDIHKQFCVILPVMENETGALFDTRMSLASFHDDFGVFVARYLPCPFADLQDRLEKIISNLRHLTRVPLPASPRQQQVEVISPVSAPPPTTQSASGSFVDVTASKDPYIDMTSPTVQLPPLPLPPPPPDFNDILDQALDAANDKDKLRPLCEQILNSLLAGSHLHAAAKILHASTGTATALDKHTNVCMALYVLNKIPEKDRGCYRFPITWDSVRQIGESLQTEAKIELFAAQRNGRIDRCC